MGLVREHRIYIRVKKKNVGHVVDLSCGRSGNGAWRSGLVTQGSNPWHAPVFSIFKPEMH